MTIDELEKIAETENESGKGFQNELRVCVAAGCISSRPRK